MSSAKNVFRLIDKKGRLLSEKNIGTERTFPASKASWHPEGAALFWNKTTDDAAWLIDSKSLELVRTISWADAGAAFGPYGLIAVADTRGVVVPEAALKAAEAAIGIPAAKKTPCI